jgi:hypothetical protein
VSGALVALLVLGVLGAVDTLVYHEAILRLPSRLDARGELRLHAARDVVYTALFAGFAWLRFDGAYSFAVAALLVAEIVITLMDFITEDRTRKLPAGERSMHAVMGIVYGIFLTLLAPSLYAWSSLPTGFEVTSYGTLSVVLTALAVGVACSGLRDLVASTFAGSRERHRKSGTSSG